MKHYKNLWRLLPLVAVLALVLPLATSCSDEPDSEYFYSFTGEMMSDYLKNRPQYSDFVKIINKAKSAENTADLMDLLSAYGHYTCFAPNNDAIAEFLKKKGLNSVDDLGAADCDTIARTHLVPNMYSTFEMNPGVLATANMMGRYLKTEIDTITAEIILESESHIIDSLKNDSVENGIVHPVTKVIEKSNKMIVDILNSNPNISLFCEAMDKTGVRAELAAILPKDPNYDSKKFAKYYYRSHTWSEVAWVPDEKKTGFTFFVEPNEVYEKKFQELGISTANGNLRALYDLAASIYQGVYSQDVSKDGWKFENLTDSINPLRRFVQYHILNRYVPGATALTPKIMQKGATNEAFGIRTDLTNPVDWYTTLLPHTMIKVEQLTMKQDEDGNDCVGNGISGDRYVNRRYDAKYKYEGAHIDDAVDKAGYINDTENGHYFYVDDIVAFSQEVQDKVQNMRIRMDFTTIFPEVMTNDMRNSNCNPYADDSNDTPDDASTPKNGRNFYFPEGYLDGVTFSNCHLVLRRPHTNFWSWQGDEWNIFGEYDFTFRIPPVPKSGVYQLRLGFCALETRGVMQVYFGPSPNPRDLIPQGIPLDMTKYLDSDLYIGDRFKMDEELGDYNKKSVEEKAEEQKLLRNLGAYRAGRSTYHFSPSDGHKYYFTGNQRTYRRILCQTQIDNDKDYYLRFRVASKSKQGNDNEFMLDYFEIVPSSVYSVDGEGAMEDDL